MNVWQKGLILLSLLNSTINADDNWTEQVLFSSTIEIETSYTDSTSDIVLATAEFGIQFEVTENVSINLVTLYKEGDVDFDIHQGFLQLEDVGGKNLTLSLGKMYLPFGQLETNLVNDTLALEMISPDQSLGFRETAAQFTTIQGDLTFAGYIFNGDVDGEDELSDWGLSVDYSNDNFNLGFDFLNNVADSAMISEALLDIEGITAISNLIATSLNASLTIQSITLLLEHIQLDGLDNIGFTSTSKPSVSQIDLGYDLGNGWAIAAAYQITNDAFVLGMPESRFTAGFSTSIYDDAVSVGLEYWHDGDYDIADGGTGEKFNGIVIQVATEF